MAWTRSGRDVGQHRGQRCRLRVPPAAIEDLARIGVERRAVERRRQQHAVAVDDVGAGRRRRRRRAEARRYATWRRAAGDQHDLDEPQRDDEKDDGEQCRGRDAAGCGRSRSSAALPRPSGTTGAQGGGGLKCRGRQGLSSRRWAAHHQRLSAICAINASSERAPGRLPADCGRAAAWRASLSPRRGHGRGCGVASNWTLACRQAAVAARGAAAHGGHRQSGGARTGCRRRRATVVAGAARLSRGAACRRRRRGGRRPARRRSTGSAAADGRSGISSTSRWSCFVAIGGERQEAAVQLGQALGWFR